MSRISQAVGVHRNLTIMEVSDFFSEKRKAGKGIKLTLFSLLTGCVIPREQSLIGSRGGAKKCPHPGLASH